MPRLPSGTLQSPGEQEAPLREAPTSSSSPPWALIGVSALQSLRLPAHRMGARMQVAIQRWTGTSLLSLGLEEGAVRGPARGVLPSVQKARGERQTLPPQFCGDRSPLTFRQLLTSP